VAAQDALHRLLQRLLAVLPVEGLAQVEVRRAKASDPVLALQLEQKGSEFLRGPDQDAVHKRQYTSSV